MDPMMSGDEGEEMPPGYTGDEGEGGPPPDIYTDADGQPVIGENGAPMTKDEMIEALRNENDQLMAQMGEASNDEEVEELAPIADEEGIDPNSEEVKSDSIFGHRRTDAVKLAMRIVEKVHGDSIDWRRVTHDQLQGYIGAIKQQRRRRDGAPSAGRETGRQAWQQTRRDAGSDNVIRLDSIGPSDIWLEQQQRAFNARRGGR